MIPERRSVRLEDGRRFVCSSPTVATYLLALELFRHEIAWLMEANASDPGSVGVKSVVALLCSSCGDGRVGRVLATCVSGPEVEDAARLPEVAVALVSAVAAVSDHAWIVRAPRPGEIGIAVKAKDASGPAMADSVTISDVELCVYGAARYFGLSPVDVLSWPLGMFQDVIRDLGAAGALGIEAKRAPAADPPGTVTLGPDANLPIANRVEKTVPVVIRAGSFGATPEA